MVILFEIIKVTFYTLTLVIGLIYSGGPRIESTSLMGMKSGLLPGYLLLSGLMIGYVVGHLLSIRHKEYHVASRLRGFGVGVLLGFLFNLVRFGIGQ